MPSLRFSTSAVNSRSREVSPDFIFFTVADIFSAGVNLSFIRSWLCCLRSVKLSYPIDLANLITVVSLTPSLAPSSLGETKAMFSQFSRILSAMSFWDLVRVG